MRGFRMSSFVHHGSGESNNSLIEAQNPSQNIVICDSKECSSGEDGARVRYRRNSDPIILKGAKHVLVNTLGALNNVNSAVNSTISKLTKKNPGQNSTEEEFDDHDAGADCVSLNHLTTATPQSYSNDNQNSIAASSHRTSIFYPWGCKKQTPESSRLLDLDHFDDNDGAQLVDNSEQNIMIIRNIVCNGKMRDDSKPSRLNEGAEYSSLAIHPRESDFSDGSQTDEGEHHALMTKRHREEIRRLKDRIAKLESELKIRKNLEEAFGVESTSSSRSSCKSFSSNRASDDEETLVSCDESQEIDHSGDCEAILEEKVLPSTTSLDIPIYPGNRDEEYDRKTLSPSPGSCSLQNALMPDFQCCSVLTKDQVERYSRHLLLAEGFGVSGQVKLLQSAVLVIGAGGIGSTVLLYLAACGVGTIGVVDFDCVESSNLHRQVIHSSCKLGMNKAVSAVMRMQELNPTINFVAFQEGLNHNNAVQIFSSYDCIVDASDNAFTRYLVNDACVLTRKPLVSGSSIGTEGQLTVHNYLGGACYRCLYPKASPSEACKSCSDNGVLGPVPGLIGVLQSIEVIKILTGIGATMHDRMLMYDALKCTFLSIKKRGRSESCAVCGLNAVIKNMEDSLAKCLADSMCAPSSVMPFSSFKCSEIPLLSISCGDYFREVVQKSQQHILLDVRIERQFQISSIKASVNIPLERLRSALPEVEHFSDGEKTVFCICRRGMASLEATRIISDAIASGFYPNIHSVKNIHGGLVAWAAEVDSNFPLY